VTDADVAAILAWHASRETQRALARRLGLSARVVSRVIQSQGLHYKTRAPVTASATETPLTELGMPSTDENPE
jgi:DNA-binding transcriptional regulator YdaS (Cro superfamily)